MKFKKIIIRDIFPILMQFDIFTLLKVIEHVI